MELTRFVHCGRCAGYRSLPLQSGPPLHAPRGIFRRPHLRSNHRFHLPQGISVGLFDPFQCKNRIRLVLVWPTLKYSCLCRHYVPCRFDRDRLHHPSNRLDGVPVEGIVHGVDTSSGRVHLAILLRLVADPEGRRSLRTTCLQLQYIWLRPHWRGHKVCSEGICYQ